MPRSLLYLTYDEQKALCGIQRTDVIKDEYMLHYFVAIPCRIHKFVRHGCALAVHSIAEV